MNPMITLVATFVAVYATSRLIIAALQYSATPDVSEGMAMFVGILTAVAGIVLIACAGGIIQLWNGRLLLP
jgi:hypothetical protein